jgi:hypothetical protein
MTATEAQAGSGPARPRSGSRIYDDIAVEAALVEHGGVLTRDDLALALGWSLPRLERALLVLEQRLRPSGQRLRRVG